MTTTRNCPYCDELISINAIKCKHCGSMLNNIPTPTRNVDPLTFVKLALAFRYEIINELGRGGMATVYEAKQKNLSRKVALKVIHQNLIHDQEFLSRFYAEAQLAASLNHPSIITIYDYGVENGVHFIAMEHLDGEDLHTIIKKKGKLDVNRSLKTVAEIADSLDYIHSRGLVHRDIKSSNIFLTKDGRSILTDFGIARAQSGSKFSQAGSVLGTPEYMSPEQADGLGADSKSDLYSLGIVLYECLTGILPFRGENPVATIYKIINSPHPPISKVGHNIPDWLESVVDKALSKRPENRFTSCREFATALREKESVITVEKQFAHQRTQKISVQENKRNIERVKTKAGKDTNNRETKTVRKKSSKPIYFIGGIILILLIVISAMLYNNMESKTSNLEQAITDIEWQSLAENEKKQVFSLIELADRLLDEKFLVQPPGNNAFAAYTNVLEIHPTNKYAKTQIDIIFRELYENARFEINKGNMEKANSLITQIREYFPIRESEVSSLIQTNQSLRLLNELKELLAKSELSENEFEQLFANVSTILSTEPDNETVLTYYKQMKNRFVQKGDNYFQEELFQKALQVYQRAKEYFGQEEGIDAKINDCRRRIETASLLSVPKLTGLSVTDAETVASANGFIIGFREPVGGAKGIVIDQIPAAGRRVPRSSTTINITYGE